MKKVITFLLLFGLISAQTSIIDFKPDEQRLNMALMSVTLIDSIDAESDSTQCEPEIVQSTTMLISWVAFWTFITIVISKYQRGR